MPFAEPDPGWISHVATRLVGGIPMSSPRCVPVAVTGLGAAGPWVPVAACGGGRGEVVSAGRQGLSGPGYQIYNPGYGRFWQRRAAG
jgi:hypothetical protein